MRLSWRTRVGTLHGYLGHGPQHPRVSETARGPLEVSNQQAQSEQGPGPQNQRSYGFPKKTYIPG